MAFTLDDTGVQQARDTVPGFSDSFELDINGVHQDLLTDDEDDAEVNEAKLSSLPQPVEQIGVFLRVRPVPADSIVSANYRFDDDPVGALERNYANISEKITESSTPDKWSIEREQLLQQIDQLREDLQRQERILKSQLDKVTDMAIRFKRL